MVLGSKREANRPRDQNVLMRGMSRRHDVKYMVPADRLTADCNYGFGGTNGSGLTHLNVAACDPRSDIANIQGWLTCQANPGLFGEGGVVPAGSYQQSCVHYEVTGSILSAMCWNYKNGRINWNDLSGMQKAQVDLKKCGVGGDIENIRGVMRCTQSRPPYEQSLSDNGSATSTDHRAKARTTGACLPGFVWRGANAQDHVCVTPQARQQAADENAAAGVHQAASAGSGPAPCAPGYVWRMANGQDHTCVTPRARAVIAADNAAAPSLTQ